MLDPTSNISAPQTIGAVVCFIGVILSVLSIFFRYSDMLWPVFSAGVALLTGGCFEVNSAKKYK